MLRRQAVHEGRILVLAGNAAAQAELCRLLGAPDPNTADANRVRANFEVDAVTALDAALARIADARRRGEPYRAVFIDLVDGSSGAGAMALDALWHADPALHLAVCVENHDPDRGGALAGRFAGHHALLVVEKPLAPLAVFQAATVLCDKWRMERSAAQANDRSVALAGTPQVESDPGSDLDALTGLPSRSLGLQRVRDCIQRAQRNAQTFAVLVLDLDRFKLVNGTLGHEVGDQLLVTMAARLRQSLRGGDVVCSASTLSRLGGDKFMVLLENLGDSRDAARVAQRLVDAVAEPYTLQAQQIVVTTSVGIATSGREYVRAEDMVRDADAAMANAKSAGGAGYVIFDAAMHQAVTNRLGLETALRDAIRDDQLTLHYQPIVRVNDGRLVGFEALVRWTDAHYGTVPACQLIEIAEETGLIHPLGVNILRMACRQLVTWQQRHRAARDLSMSVNVSRKQLLDPELPGKVAAVIRATGVNPHSLGLEITESAFLHDTDAAIARLEELRALGLKLELDDFGTGYSSLGCLYKMPIDVLKIDRAFVTQACTRTDHARVLEAIVSIARAFQLQVTVEGIETPEQMAMARALKIDRAQGYLLGRPVPPEQAEALVRSPAVLAPV